MHTIALRTNSNTTNSDSVSETSTNSDCTASTTCSNSNSVPAFLTKLWNLVEDPKYDDLICWSQGGTSFIIRNQDQFARKLLPKYYKHKNLASFIRQLNMYGFRKTSNLEHSGLKNESDELEFYHQYFLRGQGVFLECIKRKVPSGRTTEENCIGNELMREVFSEVKSIQNKQENLISLFTSLKQQNEMLWREIAIQKQKHQKQQLIVEKLVHFLASLVHSNHNIKLKRKLPLMITSEESEPNCSKVSRPCEENCGNNNYHRNMLQDSLTIYDITDPPDTVLPVSSDTCLPDEAIATSSSRTAESDFLECSQENNFGSSSNFEYIEPLCVLEETDNCNFPVISQASEITEAEVRECFSLVQDNLPTVNTTDSLALVSSVSPTSSSCLSIMEKEPEKLQTCESSLESRISLFNRNLPANSVSNRKTLAVNKSSLVKNPTGNCEEVALTCSRSEKDLKSVCNQLEETETELDWLQQHLSKKSLNLNRSTLLGNTPRSSSEISLDNSICYNPNYSDFNVENSSGPSAGDVKSEVDLTRPAISDSGTDKSLATPSVDLDSLFCDTDFSNYTVDSELLLSDILHLSTPDIQD